MHKETQGFQVKYQQVPNIVRLSRVARLAARWGVLSPIFLVVAAIVTLGTDCAGIKARQVN